MRINFNQGCFLDYTSEKELRIDEIVEEDHEYKFRFDNSGSLTHVHLIMSYVGNIWNE